MLSFISTVEREGRRSEKSRIIGYAMEMAGVTDKSKVIMVAKTVFVHNKNPYSTIDLSARRSA